MAQPTTQESTLKSTPTDTMPSSDNQSSETTQSINDLYPNLDQIKQKKRYRHSISTESPIVMLTPPNPDEVVREERRLSNHSIASAHSVASTGSAKEEDSPKDENHLLPPAEPEPEEIVAKLISQRRPSTITTLSAIIKQIFIEKKIKEDGIPQEIINGLYLGSIGAAKNLEWLKHNGVTHVLCVAGGIGECYPKQFIYKVVDINDDANEDITTHFKSCYKFIENCFANSGKCLVHCFAGMSRSVTVVSAYLMQKKRMYAVPALKFVKSKREIANPNAGFIVQLIKYQTVLGLKRKSSLDLPSSDNESDKDEEKSHKPKKKSFKSLAFAIKNKGGINDISKQYKNNTNDKVKSDSNSGGLTIKLSPIVKEMDTGRRPSLFTALAKLRGLKNRARAGSTDSTHSNVSNMSENTKETKNNALQIQTNDDNKDYELPPPDVDTGLTAINQAKLQLLKEVSNETDTSDKLSPVKNNNKLKFNHITIDNNINDDDDVITPLETCNNQTFPDINKMENINKNNDKNDGIVL